MVIEEDREKNGFIITFHFGHVYRVSLYSTVGTNYNNK